MLKGELTVEGQFRIYLGLLQFLHECEHKFGQTEGWREVDYTYSRTCANFSASTGLGDG